MRKKPDLSAFSANAKDPNDFLSGGAADRADRNVQVEAQNSQPEVHKPEPTVQKIFRLRWDVANALKLHAAQQSAKTGSRVTETEIVDRLLRDYLKLK